MAEYTAGIRVGIDCGLARIGVSKCDSGMVLATPVATVDAGEFALADLMVWIRDISPAVIYVGYPINLQGQETASTQHAKDLAMNLAKRCQQDGLEIAVRLIDERLTTVTAQSALRESGRNAKNSKKIIDQAAAITLLEFAMDTEKRQQTYAGQLVTLEN